MKKHIIYLTAAVALCSCSLNIDLDDEIAGIDAIDDVRTAREAISTAYKSFPVKPLIYAMLSADFVPTDLMGSNADAKKLYEWEDSEISLLSDDLWAGYYNTIAHINILLASEQYIRFGKEDDKAAWEKIKGEAYALKAMAYLELMQLYCGPYSDDAPGIILKDKFELEYLPRSRAADCMTEIASLLTKAAELLEGKPDRAYFLDYPAVLLLQAKAALYMGDAREAIRSGEELISAYGYPDDTPSASDYEALWTDKTSSEAIFRFYSESFQLTDFNYSKERGDVMMVRNAYVTDTDDLRYGISFFQFGSSANRFMIGKYHTQMDDFNPQPINHLRLAEAYYIVAESYLGTDNSKAMDYVNDVLKKRNATPLTGTYTDSELLKEIASQKEIEFVGEGLNYFDRLRRGEEIPRFKTNDHVSVVSRIRPDDHRRLMPIPFDELKENPRATQNPGWPELIE